MPNVSRDWTELSSALRSESVRSLLIGGPALALRVEARLTEGLGLFVEATLENAARLERAFAADLEREPLGPGRRAHRGERLVGSM